MKVYHLIDHEGFGTIHRLLIPLCQKYNNHIMLTPYDENNKLSNTDINEMRLDSSMIIIHSTGRTNTYLLNNIFKLFNKKIYVFFHTSYNYQKYKNRENNMIYFKNLQSKYSIGFLVPSVDIKNQYKRHGFKDVHNIQLGIINIENINKYFEYNPKLEKYYNKIITTCSSDNPDYYYIKGIDRYLKLIHKHNLENISLIAGINKDNSDTFKKFNQEEFLNVLCHSKAYIQFSRYESYNLTATEAKRFKVPIVLLKCEGNSSCMNGNVYTKKEIDKKIENILKNKINHSLINELYLDSIKRENLEKFKESIERVV